MSLKKKIAVSFLISACIIAVLAAFEYINFIEIKKEIRQLELTDTIRSKSLQLRRHEKNFFLYGSSRANEESAAIYKYLRELDSILSERQVIDRTGNLNAMKMRIKDYGQRFSKIEASMKEISEEFERTKTSYVKYQKFFPLLELTFLERPLHAAEFLENEFSLPAGHRLIAGLRGLYSDIQILRKNGEDILTISKDLDKTARDNAEGVIRKSQIAILIFFPLFLIVGIGMLFVISNNVVNRLKLLIDLVGKTGKGDYSHIPVSSQKDEVGVLIREFNDMENQLSQREDELDKKNKELLRSKKLAAIGTLASGVAHELNNPLNNIYISAQVLEREAKDECSPIIKETLNDIIGQSIRVKRIVGDLLEFARGKEPVMREVNLNEIIMGSYKLVSAATNTEGINLEIDANPDGVMIYADPEQMERVFINLFSNAVDAISGKGNLDVKVLKELDSVTIKVSDTGKGMPADAVEKIFEPFYTTKDKGTGLGLAIVFNIIKKHNGEIRVESEEGRGTTFTITLPARKEGNDI
ncbi:MAG: GHKL domain-containing protein [Nitrospirae bacterium]|nr:GHKL domain-containing protein [Nitrospirota bacterium]